jgi:exodeoxyribonuclease V alpha subunit
MGVPMKKPAHSTDTPVERLSGSVERVTFHSEESGFCVLRAKVRGQQELVTVIGSAASITAGEYIECLGIWTNDRNHGMQFKSHDMKVVQPTTLEGIEKYLGSGMVKGIGPHLANSSHKCTTNQFLHDLMRTPVVETFSRTIIDPFDDSFKVLF